MDGQGIEWTRGNGVRGNEVCGSGETVRRRVGRLARAFAICITAAVLAAAWAPEARAEEGGGAAVTSESGAAAAADETGGAVAAGESGEAAMTSESGAASAADETGEAVAAAAPGEVPAPTPGAPASSSPHRIDYDNLRELLKSGNLSLRQKIDDYNENIRTYEDMRAALKWEQWDMESKAEDLGDSDSAAAAVYTSNAAMLKQSASQLYKRIDQMTGERSMRTIEKAADAATMTAQAMMNSYNQMAGNARARAKSAEAAEAALRAAEARYLVGLATQADVESARKRMNQAQNASNSMAEQAAGLKAKLLLLLGMEPDADVEIGAVPAPDLAAIGAIDLEADRKKAMGNNSTVLSERHARAVGSSAKDRREKRVEEAEGEAVVTVDALYQTLMEKKTAYEGACASWESAKLIYASLERRQQAGLLTNTEYLEGEAAYLEKQAAYETASMGLRQAYENYCWEIKGVKSSGK